MSSKTTLNLGRDPENEHIELSQSISLVPREMKTLRTRLPIGERSLKKQISLRVEFRFPAYDFLRIKSLILSIFLFAKLHKMV